MRIQGEKVGEEENSTAIKLTVREITGALTIVLEI